jgi:phosphoenolpyruvate carboxylase
MPVDRAASTARAFTLFFLLINTAEQVHRVRRTRASHGHRVAQSVCGSAVADPDRDASPEAVRRRIR